MIVELVEVDLERIDEQAKELYAVIDDSREHLANLKWAPSATLESTKQYLSEITEKEYFRMISVDGKLAGAVTLRPWYGFREIGYWLGKKFCGRGVMSIAVMLTMLSDVARSTIVVAHVRAKNTKSARILTDNNFEVGRVYKDSADEDWLYLAHINRI